MTSTLFKAFSAQVTRRIGPRLRIGSAHHKHTNAKAKQVNRMLGDMPRALAIGREARGCPTCPHAVLAMD